VIGEGRCPIVDTWWQTETGAHMITPLPGATPMKPGAASCPFCGVELDGRPNRCRRCGTLLGDARDDLKREGARRRKVDRTRCVASDLAFLVGLLLGGPLMTLGGEFELGLFVVLAGGFASLLRRYAAASTGGAGLIGTLLAVGVARFVVLPAVEEAEESDTGVDARTAFLQGLDERSPDLRVQSRGPGSLTAWFEGAEASGMACGEYPPEELRAHLGELGFQRVVVPGARTEVGVCSFPP